MFANRSTHCISEDAPSLSTFHLKIRLIIKMLLG